MEKLPDDVLALILIKLPNLVVFRLVCKRWLSVFLNKVLPPWKIMHLDMGWTYCGVLSAIDVNKNTIDERRFWSMYNNQFNLEHFGSYLFSEFCRLTEHSEKYVRFLLHEHARVPFDISDGIDCLLYEERVSCLKIVFCEFPHIPIKEKVLQKWKEIYIYGRYPLTRQVPKDIFQILIWLN
jgi:hypothetical protein